MKSSMNKHIGRCNKLINFWICSYHMPLDKQKQLKAFSVSFQQYLQVKRKHLHQFFVPLKWRKEHYPFSPENIQWKFDRKIMEEGGRLTSGVPDVFNRWYWIEPGFTASIKSQINIESLNAGSWKLVSVVVLFADFN